MKKKEAVTMDNEKKELSFGRIMFQSAFIHNPVLTQAIGICSIVAIFTTLRLSIIMSLILSGILIICEVLASLMLKKLSRWLRISVYMLVGVALLIPMMLFLDQNKSELYAAMGIYLPLLAVNSLIVIRCEKFAVKHSVKHAFFDAVAASVGFISASAIVGAIRELLASGTLWGKEISSLPKLSGMALPFGGLIILGFVAAFHKWLIQKHFRGNPTNTFNLRTSLEEPVFHEAGFHATSGTLSFLHDPETKKEFELDDSDESDDGEDTEYSMDEIFGNIEKEQKDGEEQ